jgi:hypothetical protein
MQQASGTWILQLGLLDRTVDAVFPFAEAVAAP